MGHIYKIRSETVQWIILIEVESKFIILSIHILCYNRVLYITREEEKKIDI